MPSSREEYLEWLQLLEAHRRGEIPGPPPPPPVADDPIPQDFGNVMMSASAQDYPPQVDQDVIQAQADALTMGGMPSGLEQQFGEQLRGGPTAESLEPMGPTALRETGHSDASGKWYNQGYDAIAGFREDLSGSFATEAQPQGPEMIEALHAQGIPYGELPNPEVYAAGSGILPEMAVDMAASYGQTALNPERQSIEQPLDFLGNAADFIPGAALAGVVGDVARGADKATDVAKALPTPKRQPLPPIASQARREMAGVGDLAHAGVREGWEVQPRGTYTDALVDRYHIDGPPGADVNTGRPDVRSDRLANTPENAKENVDNLVNLYADRVEYAVEQGVPLDWFYKEGAELNAAMTANPEKAMIFSKLNGIYSAQEKVAAQYNTAVRAFDHAAAGKALDEVKLGRTPKSQGKNAARQIESGGQAELAPKTDAYASALSGVEGTEAGEGVTDFWEMLSIGYPRKLDPKTGKWNNPAPTARQHDWVQGLRAETVAELRDRGHDISRIQAQEMNWAVAREDAGYVLPGREGAEIVTLQDSVPVNRAQHSFETAPGSETFGPDSPIEHLPEYANLSDEEKLAVHQQMRDTLVTDGRDELVDTMSGGFALQEEPLMDVQGVYTPDDAVTAEFNPSTQSRSQVGILNKEMAPESAARLESTEAVRGTITGQNASAGGAFIRNIPAKKNQNAVMVDLGGTADSEEILKLYEMGYKDVIPTEEGAIVLRDFADENPKWSTEALARENEITEALGRPARLEAGKYDSVYHPNPFGEGMQPGKGAFANMLETLKRTGFDHRADSQETRDLVGRVADTWRNMAGVTADHDLLATLDAWKSGGLDAVQKMVDAGTAPAVALTLFGAGAAGIGGDTSDDETLAGSGGA